MCVLHVPTKYHLLFSLFLVFGWRTANGKRFGLFACNLHKLKSKLILITYQRLRYIVYCIALFCEWAIFLNCEYRINISVCGSKWMICLHLHSWCAIFLFYSKHNKTLVFSFEAHQTFNEKRFVVKEICISPSFGHGPGLSFSIYKWKRKNW